ncbi:MAG: hypothetical protein ACE5OR_01080 [bacterium]
MGKSFVLSVVFSIIWVLPVASERGGLTASEVEVALDRSDLNALTVVGEIFHLFEKKSEAIWPGYRLNRRPLLIYRPDEWALLLNHPGEVEGFGPLPPGWPTMDCPASYHLGRYDDLVGQLIIDYPLGDEVAPALALDQDYTSVDEMSSLFGFIVHEAFHRYQNESFGELPWAREERYPIDDLQNNALICLEMKILRSALEAMRAGDRKMCEELTREFVAVRAERWSKSPPFVERFEQYIELNEGTAKYVEYRSYSAGTEPDYEPGSDILRIHPGLFLSADALYGAIQEDLDNFTRKNALAPDDVPRHRVYPVGAAQGFLLDYLGIEWKSEAQKAGTQFTFVKLLEQALNISADELSDLVDKAKRDYAFGEIGQSTQVILDTYRQEYEKALADFENQAGWRIEIDLNANGLSRSRTRRSRGFVVDRGCITFNPLYNVYTLRRGRASSDLLQMLEKIVGPNPLWLSVRDKGLMEVNDWDRRRRTVIFYCDSLDSLRIDQQLVKAEDGRYEFASALLMKGPNLEFEFAGNGLIMIDGRSVSVKAD